MSVEYISFADMYTFRTVSNYFTNNTLHYQKCETMSNLLGKELPIPSSQTKPHGVYKNDTLNKLHIHRQ